MNFNLVKIVTLVVCIGRVLAAVEEPGVVGPHPGKCIEVITTTEIVKSGNGATESSTITSTLSKEAACDASAGKCVREITVTETTTNADGSKQTTQKTEMQYEACAPPTLVELLNFKATVGGQSYLRDLGLSDYLKTEMGLVMPEIMDIQLTLTKIWPSGRAVTYEGYATFAMEPAGDVHALQMQILQNIESVNNYWASGESIIGTKLTLEDISFDCLLGRTLNDFLFDITSQVTDRNRLLDGSTPQGQAFNFLVNDPLMEDPCPYENTIEQRFGLATLYYSTNGDGWRENYGWMTDTPECEWRGVVCKDELDEADRRRLQEYERDDGRVVKIELPFNNLVGPIPDEIATLYQLENLDLFANSLSGSIPNGFSNLTWLVLVDLERNFLTGPAFPDSIENLEHLVALRLSRNQLTGSIPSFVGGLSNMQQIWLGVNNLAGTLPTELGTLSLMQSLLLYRNHIAGNIPSHIGRLSNLSFMRMDMNQLENSIPEELYQLTNLQDLRLDSNFLDGTISTSIGRLTNLEDLWLSQNQLRGSLPIEIESLTNLQNLILHKNFLDGDFPDVFGGYVQLEQLDVSNCFFGGSIPSSMFEIISLRLVYFSNNSLVGTIPDNFPNPPLLRDLWVDGNYLTGTIPSIETGRLQQFNEFLVHDNDFSGSMPQTICDLRQDAILDDVFADCGGEGPELECTFEICCTRCFVGDRPRTLAKARTRERQRQL